MKYLVRELLVIQLLVVRKKILNRLLEFVTCPVVVFIGIKDLKKEIPAIQIFFDIIQIKNVRASDDFIA
jgi:hypothetical protein